METVYPTQQLIRSAAINLLAMREHSAGELKKKLIQKYHLRDLIEAEIERLQREGFQSDERFADVFVTQRKRQGKGPVMIAFELREKGVAPQLITDAVDPNSREWNQLAVHVKEKKFGLAAPQDQKEKAKQMRFLASRGFSPRHIQSVFNSTIDE